MIAIRKFKQEDEISVLAILLAEEQVKFTSPPENFVSDTKKNIFRFVISSDNTLVGYFKIDDNFSSEVLGEKNAGVGLRSFAIDRRYQGKGIGKKAVSIIANSISEEFTTYEWVYLTVNCKNKAAYHTYLKGGFEDTGELYLDGPIGPQHIMRAKLY
ncbi:GNAT family N-acetyltransferase [Grimontia sp. NTOU-MAR1]|uniref:GNAT family N-acetyltransferase n=1 Tax=Grimontia sp. NTOU-MAR1 TaxID=3111011 RepID=UPI002DBA0A88|nr:GNAT family N-acetyltransferase [Grimontia sp. NTOU-MAR1]WRV98613.1 GNAT family N-acetyltransferase [Grimontia sp. NTOU-MAR1]